jgi:hypothetical protein
MRDICKAAISAFEPDEVMNAAKLPKKCLGRISGS